MRRFFSVNSTYSATISIVSEFNVKSVLQSKAFVKKKSGHIDYSQGIRNLCLFRSGSDRRDRSHNQIIA